MAIRSIFVRRCWRSRVEVVEHVQGIPPFRTRSMAACGIAILCIRTSYTGLLSFAPPAAMIT